MTRQEILNSNLPPEEKQRRLNMLNQISASTSGASLSGLLQSSMQNMGNNPLGITPVPVLAQTPTSSVNIATPRQNISQQQLIANALRKPVSTNILQQGMQPPTIAQQIQPPKTAKRGIFNRIEKAYQDAAPMLAMAQEFNRMGAARPMGSAIPQGDPMGAYKRAKFGDQEKKLREERLAEKLGISLEEYIKLYGKTNNPLINEVKLTAYKDISESANSARVALGNLNIMQTILDDPDFETGSLAPLKTEMAALMDNFGLLNEEAQTQLNQATTFNALANNSILPLVKQLGVNPTDRDLMFVQSAAPTLGKTKEGNKLLIKALVLAQNKKIEYQRLYAQLSATNPSLDHPTLELQALQGVDEMFREEVNALQEQSKFIKGNTPDDDNVVSGIKKVENK